MNFNLSLFAIFFTFLILIRSGSPHLLSWTKSIPAKAFFFISNPYKRENIISCKTWSHHCILKTIWAIIQNFVDCVKANYYNAIIHFFQGMIPCFFHSLLFSIFLFQELCKLGLFEGLINSWNNQTTTNFLKNHNKRVRKGICDALRDLVPFVQFKIREKHP